MATRRKTRGTPAVKLANQLLDELDYAIQSRHPEDERSEARVLTSAYTLVERALGVLKKVAY